MTQNRNMAVKSKDKFKEEFDEACEQTWSAFQEWENKREELIDVFNRFADGLDKLETNVKDVQLTGARALIIGAAVTTVGFLAAPIVVGGGLALSAVAGGLALGSYIGKELAEKSSLEKVDTMLKAEEQSLSDLEKCLNGLSQSCEGLSSIKPKNRRVIAFTQAERQLYKDLNITAQSKHTFKLPEKVPQDSGKGRGAVEAMAGFADHLVNIKEEDILELEDRAKPLLKYRLLPVVFGVIATASPRDICTTYEMKLTKETSQRWQRGCVTGHQNSKSNYKLAENSNSLLTRRIKEKVVAFRSCSNKYFNNR
ncbi:uncharacterized protein LOC133342690 [Lethenteron reissneri]|uniref:uncharacterized protein LOC133342689 n=1 Tax=Lethenteron reissneri TaxID=7753 RepID=UPI002AB7C474|nr:uncharacterized protein LOC133342689 [Lethenteron reissneri]XP_061407999.1 uncharacterized protein LOC133342690 [Lethenteron reissneri]